ncbi:MAG: hypothetical protein HZC54_22020 [Verrucomicrobia bacterium]|nr:hypothetical protein [Verrucomicrobiota bacterium]
MRLAHLWLFLFSLSVSAQSLVLDEATKAQNWTGAGRTRVGGTAFVAVGSQSAIALRMILPLSGDGPRWATLALARTNWSGYTTLRIRALAEGAFEPPLDLAITDQAGRRFVAPQPLALGAPGWNEFDVDLSKTGALDLSRLRSLAIGLDRPRGMDAGDSRQARFHLADIRLLTKTPPAETAEHPGPQPVPELRVSLGQIFPQNLIVEKFRIAAGANLLARLVLLLTDDVLFDPLARTNFVRGIEAQAAALKSQTNLVGISFSVSVPPITAGSPLKLQSFRGWLTNAYATVGDLNGRWDTKLKRLDDVAWPDAAQTAAWRDAVTFWQESVTRTLRETMLAARRGSPRAYLLMRLERLSGEAWRERPLDYYAIQRTVGCSHYSLADGGGDSREFVSGGETRALVSALATQINRRLWADSFDWSAPEGRWLRGPAAKWLDAVASRNLWLQLAAGKDGVSVPETVPALDEIARQIKPLWPVFVATRPVSPKLGVVCSASSRLMNPAVEREESRFFETFWAGGWQAAVVYEEMFRDYPKALGDYNVLALGGTTHLPGWLQDALLAWVENGGTLLCSGPPGLFDPWGRRLARLMWETFGVDEARFENPATSWRWRMDTARVKTSCVIMASDDAGAPLAIRAPHGRGEIVVSLAPFGEVKQLRDYWQWKLHDRVKRDIESPERNLHLDWRPTENPRTFFSVAINLSPYVPLKTFIIANDRFSRVLNLSADGGASPLPRETTELSTTFPLELPPGGGAVLMLEKSSARQR